MQLQGDQRPRICVVPEFSTSAGQEAVELAAQAGLVLDPWQAFVLDSSLGERPDGTWASTRIGLTVARQNGKGSILEARQLAGLFLFGERLQTYSAHQLDTALEAFNRLRDLIEGSEDLSRRVARVNTAHGKEGIELLGGQRIRFRTRTRGGGRGFSGETLYFDEAMILPTEAHGALYPTMSAQPNSQVWYTGSAADQEIHEHCEVFTRLRKQALDGATERVTYLEWSPDAVMKEADLVLDDRRVWAQANPGFGIRITEETIEDERESLDPRTFAVERLSIGDWPSLDRLPDELITDGMWNALEDEESRMLDPIVLAFDVTPNRGWSAIGAAGYRDDDLEHVEIIEHRPGTRWVVPRLLELRDKHRPMAIRCDERGPAASLLTHCENEGLDIQTVNTSEMAQGCAQFLDAVVDKTLRHLGTSELAAAVRGAGRRPVSDSWLWSRTKSSVDISPLVAVTIARQGLEEDRPSVYEENESGVFV